MAGLYEFTYINGSVDIFDFDKNKVVARGKSKEEAREKLRKLIREGKYKIG
jgi:hypothetical protein